MRGQAFGEVVGDAAVEGVVGALEEVAGPGVGVLGFHLFKYLMTVRPELVEGWAKPADYNRSW